MSRVLGSLGGTVSRASTWRLDMRRASEVLAVFSKLPPETVSQFPQNCDLVARGVGVCGVIVKLASR